MTKITFTLPLYLLILCGIVVSSPAANKPFSFRNWVEDIITNPNSNHLSPEETIDAWKASSSRHGPYAAVLGSLGDPATCNETNHKRAPSADAVKCIKDLAQKGHDACLTNGYALYCQFGAALIDGAGKEGEQLSSYCNDIARGAGYIMDSCTWTDNTVEGSGYVEGNGDILIRIHNTQDVATGN